MAAALDVWLRFDDDDDEEASGEANTFRTAGGYTVEWSHTAVGQVSRRTFPTYAEARAWLESVGFNDYSS